jgi:hypothetical protein
MNSENFFIVKDTQNGKGVFAGKNFDKGEIIFEFRGKFFTYKEIPSPYSEIEDHYVQIGEDLYMGPSGGIDDLFNHSCHPNTGLKISDKKVFMVVIEKINTGDEITWDYSTTIDEDDWEMDCNCKSENCRGRIRDFKYLPSDIQKKYLDLGIVPEYISKNFQKDLVTKKEDL